MTVDEAFHTFDAALKLDPTELQQAIDAHHRIRDILTDAGLAPEAILQGSLARKTMIRPLRDIDLVEFLASNYDYLRDNRSGPEEAMDLIQDALATDYPDAEFERSRHALKMDLGSETFSFDIVPAFDSEDSELVEIANRDERTWDESDTRSVIRAVQKRNKASGGVFVHQVRMLKHWLAGAVGVPGFVMECLAFGLIEGRLNHVDACTLVLTEGAGMVESAAVFVPDGDEDILKRLSDAERSALVAALVAAGAKASEAIGLAVDGDEAGAIDLWHDLFGDPFPSAPEQSQEAAFAASVLGGVTSSGRATASSRAVSPTPGTRSWRFR